MTQTLSALLLKSVTLHSRESLLFLPFNIPQKIQRKESDLEDKPEGCGIVRLNYSFVKRITPTKLICGA